MQVRMIGFAGGTIPAQWEDVTGTTPLSFVNDTVVLTTSVSARYVHRFQLIIYYFNQLCIEEKRTNRC